MPCSRTLASLPQSKTTARRTQTSQSHLKTRPTCWFVGFGFEGEVDIRVAWADLGAHVFLRNCGLAADLLENPGSMILLDRPRPVRFHHFQQTAHCVSTLPGEEGTRELVEFGRRIGMRPEWLHHRGVPGREHFDLFDEAIDRARSEGAREVGRREFVERFIRGTRPSPVKTPGPAVPVRGPAASVLR